MSALPPKADMRPRDQDVCFGPIADQVQCSKSSGLHAYQINVKAKTLGRQYLPDRKRSADIIDCCAEYTEREAAANEREQHGRLHAVDRLLVDVKLASEVGHRNSPCNTLPAPSPSKLPCDVHWGCDVGHTESQAAR
jgi:hypothetical protein